MTTLDRLQIQGIRSYGAGEAPQNIDFKPPLTLILGANGSGKTTIIECLRMACTGALPPNANRGASFVNDPKVARNPSAESKGQIKMRFRTQQDILVTVGRSFQLTNKKGDKQEFKQMEQYISYGTGPGASSTTKRCSDIDKLVPEVMGVSPAVLQNVIFCHQEDSNWVLGEPKVLKEKFDAIFASSRYSQALDAIKKLQSEQRDNVKTLEGEEKALAIHKKSAHDFRKEKTGSEELRKVLVNEIKSEEEGIQEKRGELRQVSGALAKFDDFGREKAKIETKLGVLESQKAKLAEKLQEVFEESAEELRALAQETEASLGNSDGEKRRLEQEIRKGNTRVEQCETKIKDLRAKETSLRSEQIYHKKREKDRLNLAAELAQRYGINSGLASQSVDSTLSPVYNRMKEISADKSAELQRAKREHEQKESQTSTKVSAKQRQKDRTDHEIADKKRQISEKQSEVSRTRAELSEKKLPPGKLEDEEAQVKKCGNLLNKLTGKDAEHNKAIRELEQQEKEMEEERGRKTQLKKEAEGEHTKAMFLKEKMRSYDQQKQEVSKGLKEEEHRLRAALGSVPPLDRLSSELADLVTARRSKVDSHTAESAKVKAQLTSLRASCNDKNAEIDDLEGKTARISKEVNEADCDGTPIQTWEDGRAAGWTIETVVAKVEEQKESKLAFQSMQMNLLKMVKMYKKTACKDRKCPLCKRGYDSQAELDEFLESLDQNMQDAPEAERQAREETARFDRELQVLRSMQAKLREKEGLQARKAEAERGLEEAMKQLDEREQEEAQVDEGLGRARAELNDAEKLEGMVHELDLPRMFKVKKELEEEKAKGAGRQGQHDRARLEADIEDLDGKISQIRNELKQARDAKDENKRLEDERKHNLNLAREKLLRVEQQAETCKKLEQSLREAEEVIDNLTTAVRDLSRKTPDLDRELREAEDDKLRQQKEHVTAREKIEGELAAIRKDLEKLGDVENELLAYKQHGKEDDLKETVAACEEKERSLEGMREAVDKIKMDLQDKESGEAKQREMLRTLNDNIEYKDTAKEMIQLQRKQEELDDELRGLPSKEDLERKAQDLRKEIEAMKGDMDQKKGKMGHLEDSIGKLKQKLAQKEYTNIDERYKMKSIELQTTKCAQKDLEKYYSALDKALMRYHEIKMEEINKIVKEIWQVTYKGDDIDTIQIKADLENTGNRRSHNYRLVMRHRHLADLDMRGRCSAGQKVLASLVVRMALAETFCHNCGILALDEPTSNLDERNIKGFTDALSNIVNQRKQQNSSFQLVVISHDKDFIDDLARATEVPVYYRVEKSPSTQSSMITKHVCTGEY